jgi:hypothetical protein
VQQLKLRTQLRGGPERVWQRLRERGDRSGELWGLQQRLRDGSDMHRRAVRLHDPLEHGL